MTGQRGDASECERAVSKLYAFLDHELTSADEDEIREHLAACEPCLDTFDAETALRKLIKRSCSGDVAPEHLRAKIHAVITTTTIVQVTDSSD